jgi:hypothetical protein
MTTMSNSASRVISCSPREAIGYITPADFLAARGPAIWAERDRRLAAARELRRIRRAELHPGAAA